MLGVKRKQRQNDCEAEYVHQHDQKYGQQGRCKPPFRRGLDTAFPQGLRKLRSIHNSILAGGEDPPINAAYNAKLKR